MGGSNCAQAVFTSFCETYGLQRDTGMMLCSNLGGGIAGSGNTCGAVMGGLLVIGLHYGKGEVGPMFNERSKMMAHMFMDRFREEFSHTSCRELLGYDMSKPGEKDSIRSQDLYHSLCPDFVGGAVRILEGLIGEQKPNNKKI